MEQGEKRRIQGPFRICGCSQGVPTLKTIAIKGFQGTSLLDFPGRVASLVFTGGCNLSCPYCHNGGLVLDPEAIPDFPPEELLADLQKRQGFVDGVVVSGGEPTIDAGLPAFLARLKDLGLEVKLDTNGLAPRVVAQLLADQLVDYYAVDIKTSPGRYHELHHGPIAVSSLHETVAMLKQAPVEVEFRTTCIPALVGTEELDAMAKLLEGAPLWVLQQFAPSHAMDAAWQQMEPYTEDVLRDFAERVRPAVGEVRLRGL